MFVFIVMPIKNIGIFSNKSHLITNTIFLYKVIATAYIKKNYLFFQLIMYFYMTKIHKKTQVKTDHAHLMDN